MSLANFMLKEDGVPQQISVQMIGSGEAKKLGAGLVVLLLDESKFLPQMASGNGSPNANTTSLAMTISNVLRKLPVEAPVAIYSTDYQLHAVRDFTWERGTKRVFPPIGYGDKGQG